MLGIVLGIFCVLHGVTHLLYFGHSRRLLELQPGLAWPDGSWAFSRLLGEQAIRVLAGIGCATAALLFIGGGAGMIVSMDWWRPVIIAATLFSSTLFALFWDGTMDRLDGQGVVGVLINGALLAIVLLSQAVGVGV